MDDISVIALDSFHQVINCFLPPRNSANINFYVSAGFLVQAGYLPLVIKGNSFRTLYPVLRVIVWPPETRIVC